MSNTNKTINNPSLSRIISEIRFKDTGSFIDYFEEKLVQFKNTKSISYHKHLTSKLNNLKEFLNKQDLLFTELNVSFLNRFEAYLMDSKRDKGALNSNSAISNLRAIRTILYEAIKEERYEGKNPFYVKKLSEFKVVKMKLSIQEVKNLEGLELEKGSSLWHTKNYFLFAFYAAGTRFSDIAQLKWDNIQEGRLSFIMDKTEKGHSINLIPKALEILEQYRNPTSRPDSFVFPIFDSWVKDADLKTLQSQIGSKNAMINVDLKKIQKLAEIEKKMTFHLSRHSFADILRSKGASVYDIKNLLGHSDIKITERYLKGFDTETSDKALNEGLDF
ncbi:MAG: site-specific integrase [Bacteroidota bacterium]|nr:site-specific integrase [Bacteroidota bacterium]